MKRDNVLQVLLMEASEVVPNRDVFRVATRSQLEKISEDIDFKPINDFIDDEDLLLRAEEIPSKLRFEVFAFFVLGCEFEGIALWNDKTIFDIEDEKTEKMVSEFKQLCQVKEELHITEISTGKVKKYAISSKPDF